MKSYYIILLFFHRFDSVTRSYYRDTAAAIVCYDIFKPRTWDKAKMWVLELQRCEPVSILHY